MAKLSKQAQDVLEALGTTDMGPGQPLPIHVLWAQILDGDAMAEGIKELQRAGLVTCPDDLSVALTQAGQDLIRTTAP
jgi:hypothetical protein